MTHIGRKRPTGKPWSNRDRLRLFELVTKLGPKWALIGAEINRSAEACESYTRKHGTPELKRRFKSARDIPDLTPEQVAWAMKLRAEGYRGRTNVRKIASIMGVRPIQLNRIFLPHEIERSRKPTREYVTQEVITVPHESLIERDFAMSRDRFCPAEILGDPPFHRSALGRKLAGLPV